MIYHLLYSADFSKAAGLWPEFAQNLGLDSILEFFSVLFRYALCRLSALILFFSFVYFAQGLLSICLPIAALCRKLIMHAPLPWSFSKKIFWHFVEN